MKIIKILSVFFLIMFPIIGLAQTSEIQISTTQSVDTTTARQSAVVSPSKEIETPTKCGILNFEIGRECGIGVYGKSYTQCYDGYQPIIGDESSCKSAEVWNQYAKDACTNHCSNNNASQSLQQTVITFVTKTVATPSTSNPTTFGGSTGGGYGAISTTATQIPATQITTVPTPTTSITSAISPQTTVVSSLPIKCGVNSFAVSNECGLGVYKNVYAQCYDGYETNLGAVESSCKTSDLWSQYAKEACVNHCSNGGGSATVSSGGGYGTASTPVSTPIIYAGEVTEGGNRSTPLVPAATPISAREWISVCSISNNLMQQYNELILELQKVESDKIKTEDITRQIVALKQYIEAQKKVCTTNPQTAWQVATSPVTTENKSVVVTADRCNEAMQWETKIAYYKKLSGLNNDELKKSGFSREEIEKILQELSRGIEQVRSQCNSQNGTIATPSATITESTSITEAVRPVVIESGQEIGTYYKTRLEKAVSTKGEDKQIQELKTLRDEIDGLISNLIKSRKELEVSELDSLVKEVTVSRGEIKADDISVKTTAKKMLVNIGDRPVSVEPTASQVLIRDKGLEVNTDKVTITENVVSVGGVPVKMSASEVTEKLGLVPTSIELTEENNKAVYNMTIDEPRKMLGLIPFNSQKTVTADAENGNKLSEQFPWYNFLTTK